MALNTFVLAIVIEFVMVSDFALALIEWSPLLMPATTAIAIGILGRYRGLRLSEIGRFAPIWLERRRRAKADAVVTLPEGVTEDRRKGLPDMRRVPEPEASPDKLPDAVPPAPPPRLRERAGYRKPQLVPLHRSHGMVLAAMAGRRTALRGMWVIGSADELTRPDARRRVPQTDPVGEAQRRPRLVASGGRVVAEWADEWKGNRPPIHNAWVIRGEGDI